ncbi:MAG: hypothetical protein AVDCRST_MAG02-1394 [uncultured Rubrobacteraceae bacterium]|uniref:Uncharacterized protein n=1 Tax=uncultured Rubrobacteraceae bacterium TaxID=349277 RepID=A0A6J4QYI1_9ACTN|nr:MAG: hypothetical protein AVDCRST_MAG02-1394 [uncultured Rubrobacteraceae bacterium]
MRDHQAVERTRFPDIAVRGCFRDLDYYEFMPKGSRAFC